MGDLVEERNALIERIKQVFPKNPPVTKALKLVEDYAAEYSEQRLREIFGGKLWEEVVEVSDPSIIYILSEIDYYRRYDR